LFDKTLGPSFREYKELTLDKPIVLKPGETRVIYIHSTLPGDEAIVYDNSYYGSSSKRFEDDKIAILTGRAHVSSRVFGQDPIWGWGNAWRDRREFVGRLAYGTVYRLWNPEVTPKFGSSFHDGIRSILMCQRRAESPMSRLPDECIYYILNMCRWDWFNDDSGTMKDRRKRERAKIKLALEQRKEKQTEEENNNDEMMEEDSKPSATSSTPCSRVTRSQARNGGVMIDDDAGEEEEDFEDAEQEEEEEDAESESDDDRMEEDNEEEEDQDSENWSDDEEDQYHTVS
jgi:hypothetical protein